MFSYRPTFDGRIITFNATADNPVPPRALLDILGKRFLQISRELENHQTLSLTD
jgi:hypothetical protein